MTENLEVGEVFKKPFGTEVIKWRIPNVSSLAIAVDTELQSPPFSFQSATWILKLYPHGSREQRCEKQIIFSIERLQSQLSDHNFSCSFFFEGPCGNSSRDIGYDSFVFNSNCTQKNYKSHKNWFLVLYHDYVLRCNDTVTLVCEIQFEKNPVASLDCETKSQETTKSCTSDINEVSLKSIGKLSQESFETEIVIWKVPNMRTMPDEVDNMVQSSKFSYAGACWILKMFPCGQNKFLSENCVDVVIERVHSQIPNHSILYDVFLKAYDEKDSSVEKFIRMSSTISLRSKIYYPRSGSFTFDSNNSQENVIYVTTYTDCLNLARSNRQRDAVVLVCVFRSKKTAEKRSNSQMESFQSPVESSEDVPRNETVGYPFACKDCDYISQPPIALPGVKMLQDFKELYLKQEDCDVILKVKEQEFPAHRLILKARSPVFASTFKNDMMEKVTGIVDIKDCDPSSFSDFLYFLYCGCIKNFSTENVFSLFTTADKYDVQDLRTECLEFTKKNLSVDTFCDTVALALQHSEKELLELTTRFFAKNLEKLIVTVKWQSFVVENPIQSNEIMIKALVTKKK